MQHYHISDCILFINNVYYYGVHSLSVHSVRRSGGATIAFRCVREPRKIPSRNSDLLGHAGAHSARPWVGGK